MEKAVAILVIVNFLVIGCSHVYQREGWREFFALLQSKGRAGAFTNGFLSLGMGSMIVAFHNVWTGIPIILTLMGWAYLAKAATVFMFPDLGVRSMESVRSAKSIKFVIAGGGMIAIALLLTIHISQGGYG